MTFHVVAGTAAPTNVALVGAVRGLGVDSTLLHPGAAGRRIRAGDVALGRVDVLPSLDGVEACVWQLRRLERRGARVLNGVGALLAAHDKLVTAVRLGRAGVPHPRTTHIDGLSRASVELPCVLKPRFGSWGRDVWLCETQDDLKRALARLRRRRWLRRQGVLAQELVPPTGRDLRLIVARDAVIGAIERVAAPGEWRTNVALGAVRRPVVPPPEACELAIAAASSIGADLVGVDLLPDGRGGWVALELNGAVEFTREYSFPGRDVYEDAARVLTAEVSPALLAV